MKRAARWFGWVLAILLAVALAGSLVSRPTAHAAPVVTTTTIPNIDSPPVLTPPNVYSANGGCSISAIQGDLNMVELSMTLLGRDATTQDAETFGRAFYNCLFFTA